MKEIIFSWDDGKAKQNIRFIFDKLSEAERDNTSRLMKIADMIRA